jgi:hypothetical protein
MSHNRSWVSGELEEPLLELLERPGAFYAVFDGLMHIAMDLADNSLNIHQDESRAQAYADLAMAIKRTKKAAMRVL